MKVDFKVLEYSDDLPISSNKKKEEIKQLLENGYEVKGFSGTGNRYSFLLVKYEK